MKWTVLSILLFGGCCTVYAKYLLLSGKVELLTRRNVTIQIDDKPIPGDILDGRYFAILTRRDRGKEHSYQLYYEGDVDYLGDMGAVADCGDWIAPRLPMFLATCRHPGCSRRDPFPRHRRSLLLKHFDAHSMEEQFTVNDGSVVRIRLPH